MDDISFSLAFNLFFSRVNTLLDESTRNHKLSKKEISLNTESWTNKNIESLMREHNRLFKPYCNENNPTLKVAKPNKYENTRNLAIFKVNRSKKEYYKNYFQKLLKNVKKTGMTSNQL